MRLLPIATAFPGLLRWKDLWELDFREEAILLKMARVAKLQQEVDAAQAVRLGRTTEKCYKERMGAISSEITRIASCQTKDEGIAQNRRAFRRLFGVKEKKNG